MRSRPWRGRGRERSRERAAQAGALPRAGNVAPRSAVMKIADDSPPIVSALDRPNSYIYPFPPDIPTNASFPFISRGSVYRRRCLSVSPEGRYERRFPLHEVPASDLVPGLYGPAGPARPSSVHDGHWTANGQNHGELGHQRP